MSFVCAQKLVRVGRDRVCLDQRSDVPVWPSVNRRTRSRQAISHSGNRGTERERLQVHENLSATTDDLLATSRCLRQYLGEMEDDKKNS